MARTKQTARMRSHFNDLPHYQDSVDDNEVVDEVDSEDDNLEIVGPPKELTKEMKVFQKEIRKGPMQDVIKYIEQRYDANQRPFMTIGRAPPRHARDPWWEKYALCVIDYYDQQNQFVQHRKLHINSQHLKDILGDVVGTFQNQSYITDKVAVEMPPQALYHYYSEIVEEARVRFAADAEGTAHMKLLLDLYESAFGADIAERGNNIKKGLTTFSHLWTHFKPGTLVYCPGSHGHAYTVESYTLRQYPPSYLLILASTGFDGNNFGSFHTNINIDSFDGVKEMTALNCYPMIYHPRRAAHTTSLIKRGRLYERLAGQHFVDYNGTATNLQGDRFNINSRVMIDPAGWNRLNANHNFRVQGDLKSPVWNLEFDGTDTRVAEVLTDDEAMLCPVLLRGYAFSEKSWMTFNLQGVSPIVWNEDCFSQLVLADAQKDLVQALVAQHVESVTGGDEDEEDDTADAYEDIVKGKNMGLNILLHGPPGVGKTLTAECVAEFSRRPLLCVTSGDLGTQASDLEEHLKAFFELATMWGAVVLIDEADVFLEARTSTPGELERNALVAVFLRIVEYYSGILFLTTNRVKTFDKAFKSRVHVALKYDELSQASRKAIWARFVGKLQDASEQQSTSAKKYTPKVTVDQYGFEKLSEYPLNGRQIKNVVRTAGSLAKFRKNDLDNHKLEEIVKIQMQFEKEMQLQGSSW